MASEFNQEEFDEALGIVLSLADANVLDDDDPEFADEVKRQADACNLIERVLRNGPPLLVSLDETERGNIWLTNEEGGFNHNAWIKLGSDWWLEIAIRPENYPGLNVSLVKVTDIDLAAHINKECAGMVIRKCNIDGVLSSSAGNYSVVAETEEEE